MIFLSVGMPRAGSGWHYNLINDLVTASGGQDGRVIRRRYLLSPILTEVNCNIGALTRKRVYPLMVPALLGNTFSVKTHAGPKPWTLPLIEKGRIKPAYIYRDPRAALLSAFEYGRKGEDNSRPNAFSALKTIEDAITFMAGYVRISQDWLRIPQALAVRYEDFLADYDAETARLLPFLGIQESTPQISAVIDKHRPGQAKPGQPGLHFSKGQPERFRQVLTADQLARCAHVFGDYLDKMGYQI